ncbi:DHA2 family efflux MFS transporter permease subunit [Spirillospora sp. CA-253888]
MRPLAKWRGNPWAVLLTLSLGFFVTLLDLTIVNIAVPDMIRDLRAPLDEILWILNAYVLVMAALLITASRIGDLRGHKTLFLAGVAVFTLASLACALSVEPWQLIAARGVQGLGAALLMPQTITLIVATFPPERFGTAFGIWGSVAGVATVAGPTAGGLLVTAFGWRSIFYVNLPLGIAVLALGLLVIPGKRVATIRKLDVPGAALVTASLFFLVFVLIEGQRYDWGTVWGPVSIPLLAVVSALLFAAFLVQQRRRQDRDPLVPFGLFRVRNYTVMSFVAFAVSLGMTGVFLPFTLYFQSVVLFSPLKAGMTIVPLAVASALVAPLAGRLADKVSPKYLLAAGLLLYAAGDVWIILEAGLDSPWQAFVAPGIVAGVGVGLTIAPMTTVAMRDVDLSLAGAAAGVTNTVRQIGSAVGVGAVGAILQHRLAAETRTQDYRHAFLDAMVPALAVPIGILVLAAGLTLLVRNPAHRRKPFVRGRARQETAIVIGAGSAGLASAAVLQREGLRVTVLERADAVGSSWRGRYDGLRLNTVRMLSGLQGMRIPRRYGRWVSATDYAAYLEDYARGLDVRLGVTAESVRRTGDGWCVATSDGEFSAEVVVVASGHEAVPVWPDCPGREGYAGTLVHATDYRDAAPYAGKDVLVVGAGNSGTEIAVQLAGTASRVRLAVRTPPLLTPVEINGVPLQLVGHLARGVGPRRRNHASLEMHRKRYSDLARYGLEVPSEGAWKRFRRTCLAPTAERGFADALRSGRVEVVGALKSFESDAVVLDDGVRLRPDAVIAATGYRPSFDALLSGLGVLDDGGRPLAWGAPLPDAPFLFVVGAPSLDGNLLEHSREARRIRAALRAAR